MISEPIERAEIKKLKENAEMKKLKEKLKQLEDQIKNMKMMTDNDIPLHRSEIHDQKKQEIIFKATNPYSLDEYDEIEAKNMAENNNSYLFSEWLEKYKLEHYRQKFEENGYDFNVIDGLDEPGINQMIKVVGLTPSAVAKVKKYFSKKDKLQKKSRKEINKWLNALGLDEYAKKIENMFPFLMFDDIAELTSDEIINLTKEIGCTLQATIKIRFSIEGMASGIKLCLNVYPMPKIWIPSNKNIHIDLTSIFVDQDGSCSIAKARKDILERKISIEKLWPLFYVKSTRLSKYFRFELLYKEDETIIPEVHLTRDQLYLKEIEEKVMNWCESDVHTLLNENSQMAEDKLWKEINLLTHLILEKTMGDRYTFSDFVYNDKIHRFRDVYPYDYNRMPYYIGSWMGDGFGLMQWPVLPHIHLLRKIIINKNVGMIVALGEQLPGQRLKMMSYWNHLGKLVDNSCVDGYYYRQITFNNETSCDLYHAIHFPRGNVDNLFSEIKNLRRMGKRILIHCRGGIGRSGLFRLMYKAWNKEIKEENVIHAIIAQRALRKNCLQTQEQFAFLKSYVKKVNRGRGFPMPPWMKDDKAYNDIRKV